MESAPIFDKPWRRIYFIIFLIVESILLLSMIAGIVLLSQLGLPWLLAVLLILPMIIVALVSIVILFPKWTSEHIVEGVMIFILFIMAPMVFVGFLVPADYRGSILIPAVFLLIGKPLHTIGFEVAQRHRADRRVVIEEVEELDPELAQPNNPHFDSAIHSISSCLHHRH